MKKIIVLILLIFLITPCKAKSLSISASSSILMDTDSNRILYSKNVHKIQSVASISKIMTAIIAIESGKLNDKVTIGDEIKKSYGSGIYIKQGEVLTLRDLVYGLMLRSGNDAALSIANYVSNDTESFVKLMNKKANELRMNDTVFNNPSGLDEEKGNYSSSYDMALLMSYAIKNKEFKKITSTKKYTLKTNKNTYVWNNKNKLLNKYKYATGGKTGFTKIAKRTLVTTASKNNMNLVVVTLNDGDDWNDHIKLFNYGFDNYKNYKVLDKNKFNVENENYYKDKLYIKHDYYYPISKEESDEFIIKMNIEKKIKYKDSDNVGNAQIYFNNRLIHSEKIYIKKLKQKKNSSFFKKISEWIKKNGK